LSGTYPLGSDLPSSLGLTANFTIGVLGNSNAGNVGVMGMVGAQTSVGVWGHNGATASSNSAVGVVGSSAGGIGRGVMGQATGTGGAFGVYGTATGSSGTNYGVFGTIPSTGSSTASGVRGENLSTSGGTGVTAYTAASSGRSIVAIGSVFIENRSASGSATSATDGLIIQSNSGASGFNSSGALFTPSDRNVKNTFTPIDEIDVLNKLVGLPVTKWHYRNDSKSWYMGPMAQDFMAAFGLGDKDTVIHGVNADGVALAAIKGLNTKVEDKSKALEARLNELESRVVTLEQALNASRSVATGNLGIGMAVIGVPAAAYTLVRRRRLAKQA
jgi:hypothetical protein